ncbi:hypothetical protein AAMO2058_000781200 [Amorphochlora amoebiformis]
MPSSTVAAPGSPRSPLPYVIGLAMIVGISMGPPQPLIQREKPRIGSGTSGLHVGRSSRMSGLPHVRQRLRPSPMGGTVGVVGSRRTREYLGKMRPRGLFDDEDEDDEDEDDDLLATLRTIQSTRDLEFDLPAGNGTGNGCTLTGYMFHAVRDMKITAVRIPTDCMYPNRWGWDGESPMPEEHKRQYVQIVKTENIPFPDPDVEGETVLVVEGETGDEEGWIPCEVPIKRGEYISLFGYRNVTDVFQTIMPFGEGHHWTQMFGQEVGAFVTFAFDWPEDYDDRDSLSARIPFDTSKGLLSMMTWATTDCFPRIGFKYKPDGESIVDDYTQFEHYTTEELEAQGAFMVKEPKVPGVPVELDPALAEEFPLLSFEETYGLENKDKGEGVGAMEGGVTEAGVTPLSAFELADQLMNEEKEQEESDIFKMSGEDEDDDDEVLDEEVKGKRDFGGTENDLEDPAPSWDTRKDSGDFENDDLPLDFGDDDDLSAFLDFDDDLQGDADEEGKDFTY